MRLAVEIEDQENWPPDFAEKVVGGRSLILSYQRERSRIDRLGQDDIRVRLDPPKNEYKQSYTELIDELESLLTPHKLVAYHCSRLTAREISSIKEAGLSLLSPALVRRKIDECYADKLITSEAYQYLSSSQHIAACVNNVHANRADMIWFCPNRSTLQDYSGAHRLFRSWGGEAIYWGHEEDDQIALMLRRIGTPCIVKCAISFARAEQFHTNFAERFVAQYVSDEIEYPNPPANFDLYTTEALRASDVIEVIEFADPRFEVLTRYASWPERYRINGAAA